MNRRHVVFAIVPVLLVVVGSALPAHAQQFTGAVRGAVRDANGVVPGAAVTLINEATNIAREVVTNDIGQYNFPAVPPGTYTLKVQISGFKTYESKGVQVGTQQFVTLDVTLEVGAIEEYITGTDQVPQIDAAHASMSAALDTLPPPGRNSFLIGITVPTFVPTDDPQFNRQQNQSNASIASLGGGGIRANNYLIDGVPIIEMRGRAVLNPTIEAVEEVKGQVHTYDSEMWRTGGGVFNVIAKSGTSNYHGSGFYQTRPVWGQSLNYFDATTPGKTEENTGLSDAYYRPYGGGAGGPIVKDRTFFWVATEGYRSGGTRGPSEIWPSERMTRGKVCYYIPSDLSVGVPFPARVFVARDVHTNLGPMFAVAPNELNELTGVDGSKVMDVTLDIDEADADVRLVASTLRPDGKATTYYFRVTPRRPGKIAVRVVIHAWVLIDGRREASDTVATVFVNVRRDLQYFVDRVRNYWWEVLIASLTAGLVKRLAPFFMTGLQGFWKRPRRIGFCFAPSKKEVSTSGRRSEWDSPYSRAECFSLWLALVDRHGDCAVGCGG